MREIPEKHRHFDEAKRLELAQKEFDAAAKALVTANRSARAGGKLVTESRDREQYLNWLGKAPKQSLKDRIIGLFSRKK